MKNIGKVFLIIVITAIITMVIMAFGRREYELEYRCGDENGIVRMGSDVFFNCVLK